VIIGFTCGQLPDCITCTICHIVQTGVYYRHSFLANKYTTIPGLRLKKKWRLLIKFIAHWFNCVLGTL